MHIDTKCLHTGYTPKNKDPFVVPIVQSTTYAFDSSEDIGAVFDDPTKALIYSRFANPTVMALEERIAALEGGLAAMCTSSGQAASFLSIMNIVESGDSFISTSQIYGGTANLFSRTFKKLGIECILIDADSSKAEILSAFKPNTKAVFTESLANPALCVLDIEKFSDIAHSMNVPLIVDNTFPTPILCRPIEFGADIVIHSTSKYLDGHGLQVGGCIIDSGNFNWEKGNFSNITAPDPSYKGISYTQTYGKAAYILKARMQLMRDFGVYPSAHSAFLLNTSLETLHLRMERHSQNAQKLAEFLSAHDKIERVTYPGLKNDKYYSLAQKYFTNGYASGVISINIKGGKSSAIKFMDSLKLARNAVHVAFCRTIVLHPATSTHRQLTDEGLKAAGVADNMIRVSVGLEHIDDILEDFDQALNC